MSEPWHVWHCIGPLAALRTPYTPCTPRLHPVPPTSTCHVPPALRLHSFWSPAATCIGPPCLAHSTPCPHRPPRCGRLLTCPLCCPACLLRIFLRPLHHLLQPVSWVGLWLRVVRRGGWLLLSLGRWGGMCKCVSTYRFLTWAAGIQILSPLVMREPRSHQHLECVCADT